MNLARRVLPPLSALRALEALDRLGSATSVAIEQNLSQSAVSRQLQTLEDQLGVTLIERVGRGLRLTEQAHEYAVTVRNALQMIADASLALQLRPTGGTINLAILPSFGMRWLVPRLPDFALRHPDITINMTTRLEPFSFASSPFDAAIHIDQNPWPNTQSLLLKTETVLAVCAPSMVSDGPMSLDELQKQPLLHIQTRPKAWQQWFERHGRDVAPLPGTSFDQFTTITQAALHGLGVALMPTYLIEAELASGQLQPACTLSAVSLGSYHLVWPSERPPSAALLDFRDWLSTQTEDEDTLPR